MTSDISEHKRHFVCSAYQIPPDIWSLNETEALIKLLACRGSGWLKNKSQTCIPTGPCADGHGECVLRPQPLLKSCTGLALLMVFQFCCWPAFFFFPLVLDRIGNVKTPSTPCLLAATWPIFPSQRPGHSFTSFCQLCHICCSTAILSRGCEGYNFFMLHARVPFRAKSCAIGRVQNTNRAKFRSHDEGKFVRKHAVECSQSIRYAPKAWSLHVLWRLRYSPVREWFPQTHTRFLCRWPEKTENKWLTSSAFNHTELHAEWMMLSVTLIRVETLRT